MKAQITLSNGTNVQIEGTQEEVSNLLQTYSSTGSSSGNAAPRAKKSRKTNSNSAPKKQKIGPVGLIKELVDEGFFKGQKKNLPDIQKKLEERGHIYAQSSLSPALIKLTKDRTLRRIKEKKGWVYVV
jgi:hypothetical protein